MLAVHPFLIIESMSITALFRLESISLAKAAGGLEVLI
jgi:hypothetical protein